MSKSGMSQESSKVITRQWHIVRYLLNGQYVSTTEIKIHLESLGIETELRTIQRDLLMLQGVFPLECRRDSVPHSWRWQRLPDSPIKGLDLSQALTLRLVEEQLQDVMPARLLQELQPLFEKARVVTGMQPAPATHESEQERQFRRGAGINGISRRGAFDQSPIDAWIGEAVSRMSNWFNNPDKQQQQQAKNALGEVIERLNDADLSEMAIELKRIR